ncbi:Monosaccharide ABC transporter substrate-binding protein (CUT2 family) [Paraburkholderia tropica]|uniref:ABC transporter substrate-binding protein n=1 Tax=Paraburkholderia TaxID=1822464 RepID=UPI001CB61956|nr:MULTISPECIES: ABC transporter substrate-binding protein [Paraburkholderia]CAG9222469.1 Monosaccharide ABC transporter substrate-binding protein (CUT2 family) [Paraburkholderia tropica]
MKQRKALFGQAIVAAALALAGVAAHAAEPVLMPGAIVREGNNPVTAPNQFKKAPPWRIGFSIWGFGNTWMTQMVHETDAEAAKHKEIGKLIFADANSKPAKQIADIEDMIAQKVDAIIVAPVSYTALTPVIKKAVAAGIPVIVHSTEVETDAYTTEIQGEALYFGEVGGKFLVDTLHGKGNIWVLRGQAGIAADTMRYDGLRKALAGSNIKIASEQYGDWSYNKGKQVCESLMLSNPNPDGIWSSGGDMSRACIEVFKEFGKPVPPITGEGNNGFMRAWKDSGANATAAVFPSEQGAAGIRAAVALLSGESLHKHYVLRPAPITKANFAQFYRPDLNDNYWAPSALSDADLKKFYGSK